MCTYMEDTRVDHYRTELPSLRCARFFFECIYANRRQDSFPATFFFAPSPPMCVIGRRRRPYFPFFQSFTRTMRIRISCLESSLAKSFDMFKPMFVSPLCPPCFCLSVCLSLSPTASPHTQRVLCDAFAYRRRAVARRREFPEILLLPRERRRHTQNHTGE